MKALLKKYTEFLNLGNFEKVSIYSELLIVLLALIEFFIIYSIVPVSWMTLDDLDMNGIASGAVGGTPSEFLVFTNVIIGNLLKGLYQLNASINWYVWFYISLLFLSYYSLQRLFYSISCGTLNIILNHVLILTALYFSIIYLHFTIIGAVAVFSGFFTLIYSSNKTKGNFVLGVLLIVLGTLTRHVLLNMFLVTMFPFIIHIILNKEHSRIVAIAFAILLSFLSMHIDKKAYEKANLIDYLEYNSLRSTVTPHDNPSFKYSSAVKQLWTLTDYRIGGSFLIDPYPERFNAETLKQIISSNKKNTSLFQKVIPTLKETVTAFYSIFSKHLHYYAPFIIIIFYLFLLKDYKSLFILITLVVYTIILAWMLLLLKNGNIHKEQVLWSFTLPWYIVIILLFNRNVVLAKKTKKQILLFYFFLLFVCSTVILRYSRGIYLLNNQTKIYNEMLFSNFVLSQKDSLYVSLCYPRHPPFEIPYCRKNEYILNWFAGSHWNKEKMKQYSGMSDIGIYTLTDRNIIFYTRNNFYLEKINYIIEFYQTNYDSVTVTKETFNVSENSYIYKHTIFINE